MSSLRPALGAAGAAALALSLLLATPQAQAAPASKPASAPQAAVQKLDLNTATEAQLVELPKVGPATAKAILDYRKQVGTIRTVDELVNVKGIGEKTLEVLRPFVTVAAPTGGKS